MRAGKEHRAAAGEGPPRSRRCPARGAGCCASVVVGCIALFPQAIVPAVMKLTGDVARVWFLALYLPGPWQWPTIAFMVVLGIGALALAWRIYIVEDRALKRKRATPPSLEGPL